MKKKSKIIIEGVEYMDNNDIINLDGEQLYKIHLIDDNYIWASNIFWHGLDNVITNYDKHTNKTEITINFTI